MPDEPTQTDPPESKQKLSVSVSDMAAAFKKARDSALSQQQPPKPPEPPATPPPEPPKATSTPTPPEPNAPKAKLEYPKTQAPSATPPPAPTPQAPAKPAEPAKGSADYNFRQLEAAKLKAESDAKALQARLAEMEEKAKDAEKLPTILKELDEYKDRISKMDLEKDPRFQAAFQAKLDVENAKINDLVSVAVDGLDKDVSSDVEAVLRAPATAFRERQMKELVSDMDPGQQAAIWSAYTSIKMVERAKGEIEKQKAAELAKSTENLKSIKEFEAVQAAENSKAEKRKMELLLDQELERASEAWPGVFKFKDGDEEHNRRVQDSRAFAKTLVSDLRPTDIAQMAAWTAYARGAAEREAQWSALVGKLQEQVKALQGAGPSSGGSGGGTPQEPDLSAAGMAKIFQNEWAKRRGQ